MLEILNGFINTDPEKIKMARTFNANRFQLLTKIVIPANISTFINSLKVNIGLSLVGVISGEFLVSKAGLGYLIVYGGQVFQLDLVMASVVILGVVAAIMYEAVVLLEKLILKTLGLRKGGIEVVSCPTCGRTRIDLIGLANQVETMVTEFPLDIKVAVMGCVVNGPGEAKEADIGIAGGKGCGVLFKKGTYFVEKCRKYFFLKRETS